MSSSQHSIKYFKEERNVLLTTYQLFDKNRVHKWIGNMNIDQSNQPAPCIEKSEKEIKTKNIPNREISKNIPVLPPAPPPVEKKRKRISEVDRLKSSLNYDNNTI